MEIQPNTSGKSNKSSSTPTKSSPSSKSTSSTSKVLIITPEQIAKLGLTHQLNKVVQSQVPTTSTKPETTQEAPLRRKNVRVSKITIINPKPSGDVISDSEEIKITETVKTETLIKPELANLKNKLSNLLKSRPNLPIPSTSANNKKSRYETKPERKRRLMSFDDDDDDVILVDTPEDVKVVPKEDTTKVIKEEEEECIIVPENVQNSQQKISVFVINENTEDVTLKSELSDNQDIITPPSEIRIRRSKIIPTPNIKKIKENEICIQEQQPTEEKIPLQDTSQICEDVKQKIHVLSNEQISLPPTYIASLKSHLPERSSASQSTPFFIYKSNPHSSHQTDIKPIIDLVKEEIEEDSKIEEFPKSTESEISLTKEEIVGKSETDNQVPCVSTSSNDEKSVSKPENSIGNDSCISEAFSDDENENTAKTESNSETSVIDLTEGGDEGELETKTLNKIDPKIIPESSQDVSTIKPKSIKKFAAKIRKKINKTETPLELKITTVTKTYSKKTNLAIQQQSKEIPESSTVEESKNQDIAPSQKSEILDPLKVHIPVDSKAPMKGSHSRKRNISAVIVSEAPLTGDLNNQDASSKRNYETLDIVKIDQVDNEANNTEAESITEQDTKPAPKKRGRKKKSEMVKPEIIETQDDIVPDPTVETSRRGRKRKVVNYFALSEGKEFEEEEIKNVAKKSRKNSEEIDDREGIVEIDTTISCNPNDNSINCTYTAQEITPKEIPKRKRGRPRIVKVVAITTSDTEKTDDNSPSNTDETNALLSETTENEQTKTTSIGETNDDDDSTETNETPSDTLKGIDMEQTPRKRRGRRCGTEPSAANQLIATMFQNMNSSSTLDAEKNETVIEHVYITENNPMVGSIAVKSEFKEEPDEKKSVEKKKRGKKRGSLRSNSAEESPSDGPMVTCAVCSKEISKSSWTTHKLRYHNNLTWKVGDPPLDLNDQKLVMRILSEIYKRRKPLYCETCGETKKSVIGYLSHKTMCQKTIEEVSAMRVECEFCGRAVLPVSMSMHLKFCRANTNNVNPEENNSQINYGSPVQGKRKAARRAHSLIKSLKDKGAIEITEDKRYGQKWYVNFDFKPTSFGTKRFRTEIQKNGIIKCRFEDCPFETADLKEINSHLYVCEKKPVEGYTCKFCIKTYKTNDDVIQHLKEEHASVKQDESSPYEGQSDEEEVDEEFCEDYDNDNKLINKKVAMQNKTNLLHGITFLVKHRYCVPSTQIIYPPAFDWTLKFYKQNYSISNIFPNWRTSLENWGKLQPTLIVNYLPHLKYSACTSLIQNNKFVDPFKLEHHWTRYKLFEAKSFSNRTSMIFCGGPIYAMAWLPTPYDQRNCHQILAVSANNAIEKGYTLDMKYSESGLIQFWNCGLLTNEASESELPKLEFCIAHDYGPIWHLEWCPSGSYDNLPDQTQDFLPRLGVLAIGSANSFIYLYSICSPRQNSGKIFKPKPILKLVLETVMEHAANDLEAQVTKLSWSKASGHQYLAAGYANGVVAVFDLNTTSTLLNLGTDQNGIQMIMPYRVFTAHNHAVTALSLYHLNDGRRWLLTGSLDRNIRYWDLDNPIVPITNFTKYIATDGVWLNHWLSSLHSFDDSCAGGLTSTLAHQARNFESDSTSVMYSNSRVTSISGNEWMNGFVQGNVVGELQGFFPHQMFFAMDGDKSLKNKKVILGYTRLVEKDLNIIERIEEETQKLERISRSKPSEGCIKIDFSKPEPFTYNEAQEKYGLVFCDMTLNSAKCFNDNINSYYASNKLEKLYATRPNIYPMQSITKVASNPNQDSYLHLATGYQAGFVKISCIQFFNKKPN